MVCFLRFALGDDQLLVTLLGLGLHTLQIADVIGDGLLHTDETVLQLSCLVDAFRMFEMTVKLSLSHLLCLVGKGFDWRDETVDNEITECQHQ